MESISYRAIPHSPSNTSGLTSFRQLQRFPENTVPSLEEHRRQQSNSRRAPCTPNHLEMRGDSLDSTQEECQLSTSTSRRGFSQLYERDPEFAASSGMYTELPSLKARPDFPAVTQIQACVSSHNMKGCLNALLRP